MSQRDIVPVRTYLLAWTVMLALFGLNITSSFFDLGNFNGLVNVCLSALMGLLLITVLMHVRWHSPMVRIAAAGGFLWLTFLMGLTVNDYLTRASIHPPW